LSTGSIHKHLCPRILTPLGFGLDTGFTYRNSDLNVFSAFKYSNFIILNGGNDISSVRKYTKCHTHKPWSIEFPHKFPMHIKKSNEIIERIMQFVL